MAIKVNDADRKVRGALEILKHLALGQGYASVSVFDAGAGGAPLYSLRVNLERDGATLKLDDLPEQVFKAALVRACANHPHIEAMNTPAKRRQRKAKR